MSLTESKKQFLKNQKRPDINKNLNHMGKPAAQLAGFSTPNINRIHAQEALK